VIDVAAVRDQALLEVPQEIAERPPLLRHRLVEQRLDGARLRVRWEQRPRLDGVEVLRDPVDQAVAGVLEFARVHGSATTNAQGPRDASAGA
jgi:hypothetical protein